MVKNELNLPLNFNFKTTFHQPPSPVSDTKQYVYDIRPLDFNKEDLPSYEYFYNDELKSIVKQSYIDDVSNFNYKFED